MIRAVLLCADRKKLLLAYFTIFGFWLAPLVQKEFFDITHTIIRTYFYTRKEQ